jgi:hypothetical protein
MACKQVIKHHSVWHTAFAQLGPALCQVIVKVSLLEMIIEEQREHPSTHHISGEEYLDMLHDSESSTR